MYLHSQQSYEVIVLLGFPVLDVEKRGPESKFAKVIQLSIFWRGSQTHNLCKGQEVILTFQHY